MQDQEVRIRQDVKDNLLETSRHVQTVLTQVRSEQRNRDEIEKRLDTLEMRVNGDLLSTV